MATVGNHLQSFPLVCVTHSTNNGKHAFRTILMGFIGFLSPLYFWQDSVRIRIRIGVAHRKHNCDLKSMEIQRCYTLSVVN